MNKLLLLLQANALDYTIPPKFSQKGACSYDSITITLHSKIILEQKKKKTISPKFQISRIGNQCINSTRADLKPKQTKKNMQKWRRKPTLTVKSWTEVLEGVAIVWSKRVKNEAISEERELIGETKRVTEGNCGICKRVCLESGKNRVFESRGEEDKDRTLKKKFLVRRERIDEEQNMEDEGKWKMGLSIYNCRWTPRGLSEISKTRWHVAISIFAT